MTVAGAKATDVSDGPLGVAALTERLAVRGVLPTHAVIDAIVGGAEALVAMVKVVLVAPAGTTTLAGTVAAGGRR